MTLSELTAYLQQRNIKVESANGKVYNLGFSSLSTMGESEAWKLVDDNGLRNTTIAQSVLQPEADWEQFRLAIILDSGYRGITNQATLTTVAAQLVTRFELALVIARFEVATRGIPNLTALKKAWQDLINAVAVKLSQSAINQLNQLCVTHSMPFRFATDGSLTIT